MRAGEDAAPSEGADARAGLWAFWHGLARWHLDHPDASSFLHQCKSSAILTAETREFERRKNAEGLASFEQAVAAGQSARPSPPGLLGARRRPDLPAGPDARRGRDGDHRRRAALDVRRRVPERPPRARRRDASLTSASRTLHSLYVSIRCAPESVSSPSSSRCCSSRRARRERRSIRETRLRASCPATAPSSASMPLPMAAEIRAGIARSPPRPDHGRRAVRRFSRRESARAVRATAHADAAARTRARAVGASRSACRARSAAARSSSRSRTSRTR